MLFIAAGNKQQTCREQIKQHRIGKELWKTNQECTYSQRCKQNKISPSYRINLLERIQEYPWQIRRVTQDPYPRVPDRQDETAERPREGTETTAQFILFKRPHEAEKTGHSQQQMERCNNFHGPEVMAQHYVTQEHCTIVWGIEGRRQDAHRIAKILVKIEEGEL